MFKTAALMKAANLVEASAARSAKDFNGGKGAGVRIPLPAAWMLALAIAQSSLFAFAAFI